VKKGQPFLVQQRKKSYFQERKESPGSRERVFMEKKEGGVELLCLVEKGGRILGKREGHNSCLGGRRGMISLPNTRREKKKKEDPKKEGTAGVRLQHLQGLGGTDDKSPTRKKKEGGLLWGGKKKKKKSEKKLSSSFLAGREARGISGGKDPTAGKGGLSLSNKPKEKPRPIPFTGEKKGEEGLGLQGGADLPPPFCD